MKYFINVVIALILFSGCDKAIEDNTAYVEHESPVGKQALLSKSNSMISFKVSAGWGSSCGSFSRSVVSIADSVVSIKVIGKQPKDAVCLAVMSSYEANIILTELPQRSKYIFKFWQSDSTTIDTTITF